MNDQSDSEKEEQDKQDREEHERRLREAQREAVENPHKTFQQPGREKRG